MVILLEEDAQFQVSIEWQVGLWLGPAGAGWGPDTARLQLQLTVMMPAWPLCRLEASFTIGC